MASTRGKIIVLEKCVDVSSKVMVRYTDKCYHDLPVYNNNEKKFLSPTSKIKDDSNQVFCENEHSVHKFRDAYFSQSPKITPFHKKVTVLKPDQKNYSIYGDDLLPNHLGNLFGKRADEFAKAAITTKKRQTAKGKAENTILAGDPNYKEFAPEVSDWYINISSFEDIWKAIRREIGYYCGVTFYSIIIAIIINHYMDWMHHCQMLHLWIHI